MELCANETDRGLRLDRFVVTRVRTLTRSKATALILSGHIRVNGEKRKPAYRMRGAEEVSVHIPPPPECPLPPQDIPLDILYEDRDLIAVNKPAGMVVHPAAGNPDRTLVNALLAHAGRLSGAGGATRPGIVHRLDKGTSGVMICAKNDFAHNALSRQFADRVVDKLYLALVTGRPTPSSGLIDRPIGRHPTQRKKMTVDAPSRPSQTEYRVLKERDGLCCVECRPLTGRTHQIRVHLQSLGCPVLMDDLYGGVRPARRLGGKLGELVQGLSRPALHARQISFLHPREDRKMRLTAPVPKDMRTFLEYLGCAP